VLAGDLDMITLMALRKEPARRYASAEQFAEDLDRYLARLPTRAYPGSLVNRTVKFARRNVLAVSSLLALAPWVFVGLAVTLTGLILTGRARDQAENSVRQARLVVDQLFTQVTEERILDQPGLESLKKKLLQDAQWYYEGSLDEHGNDPKRRAQRA